MERTKKHLLLDILVIALCTLLTGGEGVQDMELFGKSKRAWLQTFLTLPHGIPSHDTFGRVFARLNPQRFQACFLSWTQAVAQLMQGALVSLDGKTVDVLPGMNAGASPSAVPSPMEGSGTAWVLLGAWALSPARPTPIHPRPERRGFSALLVTP